MHMLAGVTALCLLLFMAVPPAAAQGRIYKWTDAQGHVHYSDTPTDQAESVDDELPPASNFGTVPEPEAPALVSTETPPETTPPPTATDEAPFADDEPADGELPSDSDSSLSEGGPLGESVPLATEDLAPVP